MILKFVYTLFLGILFALLVGVGIAAFYTEPTSPEYPSSLSIKQAPSTVLPVATKSAEYQKQQEKYDAEFKEFRKVQEVYNRNVSIIAVIIAVLVVVLSLTLLKQLLFIADGLLIGGVLTLIYSIVRGFDAGDAKFRFVVVVVGFIVVLTVGYIKFVKSSISSQS